MGVVAVLIKSVKMSTVFGDFVEVHRCRYLTLLSKFRDAQTTVTLQIFIDLGKSSKTSNSLITKWLHAGLEL